MRSYRLESPQLIYFICFLLRKPYNLPRYFNWKFVPEEGDHPETPLETASRIGWLKGVELLLDHGVSPLHEKRTAFHDPPCALLWACKEGHADVVKVLLDKGADVECFHERKLQMLLKAYRDRAWMGPGTILS